MKVRMGALVAALLMLFLLPVGVMAETPQQEQISAIGEIDPSEYDVRADFAGELGYLLKAEDTISVSSVSVPYFAGNQNTVLYVYQVADKPQLTTHIMPEELTRLTSVPVEFPGEGTEGQMIAVQLETPITLEAGKEYLITYITGNLAGVDCMKFYNSGVGNRITPVETGEGIQVLSCTFASPSAEGKMGLYDDGAIFAVDRQTPGAAFGIPNFTYTITEKGEEEPEIITQDDLEQVEIPGVTEETSPAQTQGDSFFDNTVLLLILATAAVVLAMGMVIVTLVVVKKHEK